MVLGTGAFCTAYETYGVLSQLPSRCPNIDGEEERDSFRNATKVSARREV